MDFFCYSPMDGFTLHKNAVEAQDRFHEEIRDANTATKVTEASEEISWGEIRQGVTLINGKLQPV